MSHADVARRGVTVCWEMGEPNSVPAAANIRPADGGGGGGGDDIFVAAYADDYIQIRVQHTVARILLPS